MGFRFNTRRSLGAGLIPGGGGAILKPQDVFATSLHRGVPGITVTNGLDMLGKGALSWTKNRGLAADHLLIDSLRGTDRGLYSDLTSAEETGWGNTFLNNGYIAKSANDGRQTNDFNYVNWSFARAAKFFDIVTWTGDGTSNRLIPHGLGVVPGMIVVKRRDTATNWPVYHRSLGNNMGLPLNTADAAGGYTLWGNTDPTSSSFTVINNAAVNQSGGLYVAYLFAHDPSADGIVQCGSATIAADGSVNIPLPWLTQWFMFKQINAAGDWFIVDGARGFAPNTVTLSANTSAAEFPGASSGVARSASGVTIPAGQFFGSAGSLIFAAIRAPY